MVVELATVTEEALGGGYDGGRAGDGDGGGARGGYDGG